MPPRSANTAEKILQYTTVAAGALQDIAAATQIPFLDTVCSLSGSIISLVQNTTSQKERFLRVLEEIHHSLCALASFCIHAEDIRSPGALQHIAEYAVTLQKLNLCLKTQQGLSTIKRLFKQNEITAQLDSCEQELRAASDVFAIKNGLNITNVLVELGRDMERRHQELLELMSSRSTSSDGTSMAGHSALNISSDSFYLLPASPTIFYGRESELRDLADTLLSDCPRAVILGPGGMGKTSLSVATLHHPEIAQRYLLRHFISCESINTPSDLVYTVASHLGLEPSGRLSRAVVEHLRRCGQCLIVLDNFETPWEPLESRGNIEDFVALLADVPNLALLITMRGAERPSKIKWSRPFLPPLEPLPLSASRQIFVDVADEPGGEDEAALATLLELSGCLPLAVGLMGNIASFEGYSGTLARFQEESTALLSEGHDKRSNLERSISLSMNSPRFSSCPHVKDLLSLLSLLPDGIRTEDILASKVPIPDIRRCQSVLVRTSLAYIDAHGRLKSLPPIREYIKRIHAPDIPLAKPLRTYFQDLLDLWKRTLKRQIPSGNLGPELVSYLGNMNELLLRGLHTEDRSAWVEIGHSILTLRMLSEVMLKGSSPLVEKLPDLVEATGNAGLRWSYASECLIDPGFLWAAQDAELLVEEGTRYFQGASGRIEEAVTFHNAVASHYLDRRFLNLPKARKFNQLAMELAQQADNIDLQLVTLQMELQMAERLWDPYYAIKVVRKARNIAKFTTTSREYSWLQAEAWAYLVSGNLSKALGACTLAEELLVSQGREASDNLLALLDIRADVHIKKGEYLEARQLHQQIIQKTSPTRSPRYHANSLCYLTQLDITMGSESTDVSETLRVAEAVYERIGSPRTVVCFRVAAEVNLYHGNPDAARPVLLQCLAKSRGLYHELTGNCLGTLSNPKHRMHTTEETACWAVIYLSFTQSIKDPLGTLHALRRLADTTKLMEDDDTALNLFHAALEGATETGIHDLRAECMLAIGDIAFERGDSVRASEMWTDARPLFVRSSQMKRATAVDKRLEGLHPHSYPWETNVVAKSNLERLATLTAPNSLFPADTENRRILQ
ncbi:hypothetical protein DFH06DRAFT_1255947 [Mycena polygramma]|nr:hypothetical protein DFH06DRAFT_1255947 [Mycena polygramma]